MKGKTLKCVVVGDVAVGKTTLITTYSIGRSGFDSPPRVKELFGNRTIDLVLWDTAGRDDYDRIRPLDYPLADVFLICFSVTSPESFERVRRKWQPEVTHHCPNVPTLLVGTKIDLRSADDDDDGEEEKEEEEEGGGDDQERTQHVQLEEGKRMAEEIGAFMYVECSAKAQEGLTNVFHEAVRAALDRPQNHSSSRKCVLF